jgi:hypothetical protein
MYTVALPEVQKHVLEVLKQRQKAFNKNPNSLNWELLTAAMLTHQQAQQLNKDTNVSHLLARLPSLTMGEWFDAIVQHSTGMTIREALA